MLPGPKAGNFPYRWVGFAETQEISAEIHLNYITY